MAGYVNELPVRPTYERLNWPLVYVMVLFASAVVAGVYGAYNYPNWTGTWSITTLITVVVVCLLALLAIGMGALATVRIHTPILMTMTKCFRVARWAPQALPPISYPVNPEQVENLSTRLPKEAIQAAMQSDRREFSAEYVKLGGYIMQGFFWGPSDYFLIFFQGDICQMGDNKTGDAYFTEKSTRTVNHTHLPELWLEELRKDPDFKPGRSTILITTDAPERWRLHLRLNAERVRRYLEGTSSASVTGGATLDGLMLAWLGAEGKANRLQAENERLYDWVRQLQRHSVGEARRRASVTAGRADPEPGWDQLGDRPADYTR